MLTSRKHTIGLWFILDAVLALAPPLYWMADAHHDAAAFGLPTTLLYFLAVSACITASIVYAYLAETAGGELES